MARTTQKKGKKNSLTQRMLRWAFTPLRLSIAAVAALLWICWPAVEDELPELDSRPEYQVGVEQIVVTPPPRWVPDDVVERVFDRAGFTEPLSLLDPKLSEKIAIAFYTYPWIERLEKVKKSYPAQVYVEVVYREPVAMVEVSGGGYLPIDKHGHLLPEKDIPKSAIDRYPLVRGVSTVPVGYHGEAWGDPAVKGAAQLAAILTKQNESQQSWWTTMGLKTIEAPRRLSANDELDDLRFELTTQGGSEVVWGRPPSTRHPGEVPVATKLKRMADVHQQFKGFDSGPAPVRIDICEWDSIKSKVIAKKQRNATRN